MIPSNIRPRDVGSANGSENQSPSARPTSLDGTNDTVLQPTVRTPFADRSNAQLAAHAPYTACVTPAPGAYCHPGSWPTGYRNSTHSSPAATAAASWPVTALQFSHDDEALRPTAAQSEYYHRRLHRSPNPGNSEGYSQSAARKRQLNVTAVTPGPGPTCDPTYHPSTVYSQDGVTPARVKRLRSAATQFSWMTARLTANLAAMTRRAEAAEERVETQVALTKQARKDLCAADKRAENERKRAAKVKERLNASKTEMAILERRVRRAEKGQHKRCRVDEEGVSHPLHELMLAQPLPGEVNVAPKSQGKRIAMDWVHTGVAGSLQVREGNAGGTEYTKLEQVLSMTTDLEEGIGPKHNRGLRETNNMLRRARQKGCRVEAVLPSRRGYRTRQKGPKVAVNPFPRPCEAVMRLKIRPTFRILMHLEAARMLARSVSLNFVFDGKEFGQNHSIGGVVCIYVRETAKETRDAFGNSLPVYAVYRVPTCLQQAPNKIALDVVNSEAGGTYIQQSPFLCLRALYLSFMGDAFEKHGEKLAFVLDAAADNRGTGALQRAMDAMSSPNSMHDCITGTKSACPAVEEDLQRDGMLLLLEQMRSGKGLPRLTANLKNLRLAERAEREKTRAMKNLQTRVQTEQAAKPTAATAETAQPPGSKPENA